jgi:hypothetical protein
MSGQLHALAVLPLGKEPLHLGTHWIRGWVGPRAGMDEKAKRNKPFFALVGRGHGGKHSRPCLHDKSVHPCSRVFEESYVILTHSKYDELFI